MKYGKMKNEKVKELQSKSKNEVNERFKNVLEKIKGINETFGDISDMKREGCLDDIPEGKLLVWNLKLTEFRDFIGSLLTDAKHDSGVVDILQKKEESDAFALAKQSTPTKRNIVTDTEANAAIGDKIFKDKLEVKKFEHHVAKLKDLINKIEGYNDFVKNALNYKAHELKRFEMKEVIKRYGTHNQRDENGGKKGYN